MINRMNDIELLSAYMDGQLSGDDKDVLESRLSKEPELKAVLIQLEVTERQLKETISEIDFAPMSDSLQRVLRQESFRTARNNPLLALCSAIMDRARHLVADQMIPATAAVMVIVGAIYVSEFREEKQYAPAELSLVSAESLQQLNNIVAGEAAGTDDGMLVELLAFIRGEEVLCKQYSLERKNPLQGIACFEMGEWQNVAIVQQSNRIEASGYKPASSDLAPEINEYIVKNMVNGVLTVEDEKIVMSKIRKQQ